MKKDVITAVVTAIAGVLVAYLVATNVILKAPNPVTIKILNESSTVSPAEPNPEIFNYRALNPTVEVYIDCSNYDVDGSCLDGTGE